ncbi:MAG: hypothetical protein ACQGVK_16860 [Myxococcota bacterium]
MSRFAVTLAIAALAAPAASSETDPIDPAADGGAARGEAGRDVRPDVDPGGGQFAHDEMPHAFDRARLVPGGEVNVSYHYDFLSRGSNRTGTRRESISRVFERGFTRASYSQDVETHTFEVLYAPIDRLTLGVRLPFQRIETRHRNPDGSSFTTQNQGVGDLEFSGRLRFTRKRSESFNLHLAIQTPTGTVTQKDRTPGGRERLPYDEQVGSGTWNFLPGITYLGRHRGTSWGLQVGAEFYVTDNDEGWSRGDAWHAGGWLAHRWFDLVSTGVQVRWKEWSDVNGGDGDISEAWPSGNPNLQGGAHLVLGSTLELAIPGLTGQRLSIDASWPVYQSLDGPQLEGRWRLGAGWEWTF